MIKNYNYLIKQYFQVNLLKIAGERFYTRRFTNYNKMHPTFWNSITLNDHNFGTKSPIDLKQKTLLS